MNAKKLLKQAQLHGLQRLDDAKCRWVWITSLLLLLLAAATIGQTIIDRFLDSPTYILRKEKVRTIMDFPSVQLCPEISYPDYKIEEFFSKLKFPHHVNKTDMKGVIQQLAAFYSPDMNYKMNDLKKIQDLLDYNKLDTYAAAKMLTLSCEETLLKCRLFGQMKNCSELFQLEISQYGYCCIFNSRSLRREILEHGIHKIMPRVEYVTRYAGFKSGLVVAVNQSTRASDVDLSYKWIIVDGGQAYVDAAINGTPLSPGMEVWFGHYNRGFFIDENALSLEPGLRGCRLLKEKLTLFPIHHNKYCQLECKIWHLVKKCNCVLLTHPVPPNASTCRARDLPCSKRAMSTFNPNSCGCFHTCDADTDHVEISSFQLYQNTRMASVDSFYTDMNFSKSSVVRVFISQRNVKTKSRTAYFSYEILFAQLGGIFNVFFGFSLLSVLEIVQIIKYAFNNWRRRRKNQIEYFNSSKQGKKTKNKKFLFKDVNK